MATAKPPLVRGLPILGNGLGLSKDALGYMAQAYQEYGSVYRVRIPGREITILAGPDANHLLMDHGDEVFRLRPIYGTLVEETASDLYLPTLDEPQYSYYRKMIKPRLSREALAEHLSEATALVEDMVRRWQPRQNVPVMELMTRLCIEIISRSTENTAVGEELASIILFTNRLIGSGVAFQPAFLLKLPDYQSAKRRFEAFLQRIIDQHRADQAAEREPGDLVDLLLRSATMDGKSLEGHDLMAYVHLPFVNGVAYAPRLSGYLLYELLRHPDLMAKVRAEIDAAFSEGDLTMGSLRKMRWLYGSCMEVLRMYPIAGALPRYIAKPLDFGGYTLSEGQMVFIATGVCHFLPEFYREPRRFDPERFFEPRSEHQQPGAFAPYGLGGRTCLSAGMGEALIMLVLAGILHTADLELPTPDYRLRTRIAPIPGPDQRFAVRVVGQRKAG